MGATQATYADVVKWRDDVSQRLSDYLRSCAAGILLFCWGLMTADKGFAQAVYQGHSKWIVLTSMGVVTALVFDLLHFVFSFIVEDNRRLEMEREKPHGKPHSSKGILYYAIYVCIYVKATLIPLAFISVIALLFVTLHKV
jgi:hypothetical protein